MDLKSLGVAIVSLGAVAGLSCFRCRKGRSLAEVDDAPETMREIPRDYVDRYDRAYGKLLATDRQEISGGLHRQISKIEDSIEKLEGATSALRDEVVELNDYVRWLDRSNLDAQYVDMISDQVSRRAPRDLARMRAHANFVSRLGFDDAYKFAELAGEKTPEAIFEKWLK